jgi:hypothetical protein
LIAGAVVDRLLLEYGIDVVTQLAAKPREDILAGRTIGADGCALVPGAAKLEKDAGTRSESFQVSTLFRVIIVWFVPSITSESAAVQSRRAALDTPRARSILSLKSVVRVEHRYAIKEASYPVV